MKGAKGLLISITGGKDLTLYEVDEAATRIREEVDQDANIIVGATFDEALEGIIRVSVVATGIDQAALSRGVTPPETRLAELTHKIRSDQQRIELQRGAPERPERIDTRPHPLATPTIPTTQVQQSIDAIESAAKAAVAAALLPGADDVLIRPIPPKPSLFPEQPMAIEETAPARNFIPPAPEPSPMRPRRMPSIDELPRPAQAELRAQRGEQVEPEHQERRKLGLLRRLASVGLGRREEEGQPEKRESGMRPVRPIPRATERSQVAERPALPPRSTSPAPRIPEAISEYAKRPVHQALDLHGRQTPGHSSIEEDQLEIPAFLRRQAN
jgi:cell division protein FtsZ